MIFAAGLGTRMGAYTRSRPKPLLHYGAGTLLDHALDICGEAGMRRVVVNVHHLGDRICAHLARLGRLDVIISDETDMLRDTGGGLKHAAPLFDADLVHTLNSDVVWDGANPLATLGAAFEPAWMDALLLLSPAGDGGRDFQRDAAGRLRRAGGSPGGHTYLGAQIIRRGVVDAWPEKVFSLNAVWDDLIERGRLFGHIYDGRWTDVGTATALERLREGAT